MFQFNNLSIKRKSKFNSNFFELQTELQQFLLTQLF